MKPFDEKNSRSEKLLDAAGRLFARWGYDKTSVEEIAREAHISKGAVYLEFRDKEALFRAVVYRELARYAEDWLRRFEGDSNGWSFASMFRHSIAAMDENRFVKGLVTRDRQLYGDFLKRDATLVSMALSMRRELFDALQQAGIMRRDISPEALAFLVTTIGYGLIAGRDIIPEENRISLEDALQALALLLDRGLAPGGETDRDAARCFFIRVTEKARASLKELLAFGKETSTAGASAKTPCPETPKHTQHRSIHPSTTGSETVPAGSDENRGGTQAAEANQAATPGNTQKGSMRTDGGERSEGGDAEVSESETFRDRTLSRAGKNRRKERTGTPSGSAPTAPERRRDTR